MIRTLLLLLIFSSCANAQSLAYCNYYKDQYTSKNIATVIAVYEDSVLTYIEGVGYIKWKIDNGWTSNIKYTKIIERGEYSLSYKILKAYLRIEPKIIFHVVYIEKENAVLSIEYRRKD